MKLDSYWTDTAPAFAGSERPLPTRADVVIVGGGFTGLSAAVALARRGAEVVVLEAGNFAGEASGRNGGHVNNGLAVDYATLAAKVGSERASAWYRAYDAAVDSVAQIVRDEAIDCDFLRNGKLKLAARSTDYDILARGFDQLRREADPDVELLGAREIRDEIQSDRFVGGLLQKRSAQMHMGRFAQGLAAAAQRHGAKLQAGAEVLKLQRMRGHAHRVHTARGVVEADQVLVATGATLHGRFSSFGFWRRRIVPIGSFIVVTEPLGHDVARRLLPGVRTYTTAAHIHNYFRLTPDDRLVFGGRARFAMSSPRSDAKSGRILQEAMKWVFPQLSRTRIDYCWGGMVDMSRDRLPHAGEHQGLYYAMGYSGHGTQMSVHMGQRMAEVMTGNASANPWRDLAWPAIPGHFGKPWFLPAVGAYYKLKDVLR